MSEKKPAGGLRNTDSKFAALGNGKELLPLKSLGFDIYECSDFKQAEDIINKLSSHEYEMVIVSEKIVEGNQDAFLALIKSIPLNILVLPEYGQRKGIAKDIIKRVTREAVGF